MHKRAEDNSSHFRNLMHHIISNARSAIAVHDRDLRYIYVINRYLREFNVRKKDRAAPLLGFSGPATEVEGCTSTGA